VTADQIARERIRTLEAQVDALLSAVAILSGAPLERSELDTVEAHGSAALAAREYLARAR